MKNKLKVITDNTISELLGEDIILPSSYFECFDKHARTINVDLDSGKFEKELQNFLIEEYKQIDGYIHSAMKTIDEVSEIALGAQEAIKSKNHSVLDSLYSQIKTLQTELENIKNNVYKDYLTKTYNKQWIYQKFLTKDANIQDDCILVLLNVNDYDYIAKNYSNLISNNLLIFISKFLKDKLKDENINFEIARYLKNKFLIIIKNDTVSNITSILNNIANLLSNTTLKSNSGIIINPNFIYEISNTKKDSSFHDTLNTMIKELSEQSTQK